jgi:hypothetical protein
MLLGCGLILLYVRLRGGGIRLDRAIAPPPTGEDRRLAAVSWSADQDVD